VPPDANNTCLTAYADGRDGNAHQNIEDIRMKLVRVLDRDECNPKWRSEALTLPYGRLLQQDLHAQRQAASSGACDEGRARGIPVPHVRVEFLNNAGKVIEATADLLEGVDIAGLDNAVNIKLNASGLVDFNLAPQCLVRVTPAGQ
jgi:hypothetical protein